jgi:hypothetical protein
MFDVFKRSVRMRVFIDHVYILQAKITTTKHTVLFGQPSYQESNNESISTCNFQNNFPEGNYRTLLLLHTVCKPSDDLTMSTEYQI